MSQANADSSKVVIRAELSSRIREALENRDYALLEHWAKHWIQLDPKNPSGFKWLARAATASKQIARAAYAYGRLLDFDSKNEEARKFFAQFPSTLQDQPLSVHQHLKSTSFSAAENRAAFAAESQRASQPVSAEAQLSLEKRKNLAQLEFELAENYFNCRLFTLANEAYIRSFNWIPSRASALGSARSLHRSHLSNDAIKFLRSQLYHFPDWNEGRVLLGKILFEVGHRSDAQREWQLVLERDPSNKDALGHLKSLSHFVAGNS